MSWFGKKAEDQSPKEYNLGDAIKEYNENLKAQQQAEAERAKVESEGVASACAGGVSSNSDRLHLNGLEKKVDFLQREVDKLARENSILRGDFALMLEAYDKEVEHVPAQPAFRRIVERGSVKEAPEVDHNAGRNIFESGR